MAFDIADIPNFARKQAFKVTDPVLSLSKQIEYKRQNLWIIVMDGIPAWTANSADKPKLSLGESRKIKYINISEKLQRGYGEWMPVTFVLNDPIVPSMSKILYDKIKKQWDFLSANVGYKDDYKWKDVEIRLLHPNGYIVETWILHEPFLTGDVDFNVNGLSYDNQEVHKVKFTLDYSWAELVSGGSPTAGSLF